MSQAIVVLPLLAALVAGLGQRAIGPFASKLITTGALFTSCALSWPIFLSYVMGTGQAEVVEQSCLEHQGEVLGFEVALAGDQRAEPGREQRAMEHARQCMLHHAQLLQQGRLPVDRVAQMMHPTLEPEVLVDPAQIGLGAGKLQEDPGQARGIGGAAQAKYLVCLLYTSDAADERSSVDLGGRRIIKKKNNIRCAREREPKKKHR